MSTTGTTPSVLVIGAGFGGLAIALELREAGFTEFTVLERAADLGGVWRENTYPGAGCDIPSPLYSFSRAPNPRWPKRFSMGADIKDYLHAVVDRFRLDEHIVFGAEVTDAEFDEQRGQWVVRTGDGSLYRADVLVPATGQLSNPAMPDIPGLQRFAGPMFHSARWRHDCELAGKRVGVIGTGASAIQFVPAIQPDVERLTLFQRSAAWVVPKPDVTYRGWQHWLFAHVPLSQRIERLAVWLLCEFLALGLVDVPAVRSVIHRAGTRQRNRQVADPALRAKLAPNYEPGCKRVLFSDAYYPALARSNVDIRTESIAEITEHGVRTEDGTEHELDAVICGTGFKASDFLEQIRISGRGGRTLADTWDGGARAYLGMAVPGFPNMFVMYGPNTNLGVGSIVYMLESQARYIRAAVAELAKRPGRFEVRAEVENRYDRRLQRRLGRSVWTLCSSWYRNAAGRIVGNWPGTMTAYRWRTRRFRSSDYHFTATEDGAR